MQDDVLGTQLANYFISVYQKVTAFNVPFLSAQTALGSVSLAALILVLCDLGRRLDLLLAVLRQEEHS